MAGLLSNLVDDLSKGHDYKKCEICGIRYKYCNCFLEYINFKDDLTEYKCLSRNDSYQ